MAEEIPQKPTLLYDGDCHFCTKWIYRWRTLTQRKVDYFPFQESKFKHPHLSEEEMRGSVHLLDPDGHIYKYAAAVFKTLSYAPKKGMNWFFYRYLPGFKWLTDSAYKTVARHRVYFSKVTRFLWGDNLEPSSFQVSSWLFLKGLALIYFAAFFSLSTQVLGLYGSEGILPINEYLYRAREVVGDERFWKVPSIFWLRADNPFLLGLTWAGMILSGLLFLGVLPLVSLGILWFLYLSFLNVGQNFLSFQWDTLLLEVGFLAIFLAPFTFWNRLKKSREPSGVIIWLFKWLLFRLMFLSGMVKLLSGDVAWSNLEALHFHYLTQPLPTWVAWYAHQLPEWFHRISVLVVFVIELFIPFLIFFPKKIRHFSAWALISLQILIMVTGNYCFFNLLTILLCFLLFEDSAFPQFLNARKMNVGIFRKPGFWSQWVTLPLAVMILFTSTFQMGRAMRLKVSWPKPMVNAYSFLNPFHLTSGYGLFAVMTQKRLEIEVEGSEDGKTWKPYQFKYKPGILNQAPRFVIPMQPRLDWQMWFAALGSVQRNQWFVQFAMRLMQGSEDVLNLIEVNPFKDYPPKYIRAVSHEYVFTTYEERSKTGDWWKKGPRRLYMPTLSLPKRI